MDRTLVSSYNLRINDKFTPTSYILKWLLPPVVMVTWCLCEQEVTAADQTTVTLRSSEDAGDNQRRANRNWAFCLASSWWSPPKTTPGDPRPLALVSTVTKTPRTSCLLCRPEVSSPSASPWGTPGTSLWTSCEPATMRSLPVRNHLLIFLSHLYFWRNVTQAADGFSKETKRQGG